VTSPQRFLVEIQDWNCSCFVELSPASTPAEFRFQGGLLFTSGLEIEGQVMDPPSARGKRVRLWISASKSEHDELDPVLGLGWIGERAPHGIPEFHATLDLAGLDLPTAAACLAANWKFIRIDTPDPTRDGPNVTAFSFARE
jgi:hypothetical protein